MQLSNCPKANEDAAFIAHAPADIAHLLERVRTLEGALRPFAELYKPGLQGQWNVWPGDSRFKATHDALGKEEA